MTFWIRDHRRAAKTHTCSICGRRIDKGEVYLYGTSHDDGFRHWYECAHCEWMQTTFDISDEGAYDVDMFVDFEPRDVFELRAKAGYRMKWRSMFGTLLPIPQPMDSQPAYCPGCGDPPSKHHNGVYCPPIEDDPESTEPCSVCGAPSVQRRPDAAFCARHASALEAAQNTT